MTDLETLLSQIDGLAQRADIPPSVICRRAVGNAKLYARMKAGGGCNIRTANRLQEWITEASAALTAAPLTGGATDAEPGQT